jgi:hypothetical protein
MSYVCMSVCLQSFFMRRRSRDMGTPNSLLNLSNTNCSSACVRVTTVPAEVGEEVGERVGERGVGEGGGEKNRG